jgi:hypothetical protein
MTLVPEKDLGEPHEHKLWKRILDSISMTPQIIKSESNSIASGTLLFHNQKKIVNETDLHYSIVSCIRDGFTNVQSPHLLF